MLLGQITDDVAARQAPEAQSMIRLLMEKLADAMVLIETMAAREARLTVRIAEAEAEVAALKGTPQNSSLPPSAQHPHAKPPATKTKSGRPRGGQIGHPKSERTLRPTVECDVVVPVLPVRVGTEGDRSGTSSATGLGDPATLANRDGVSAASIKCTRG